VAAGGAWALPDPLASVDPLPPGAYPVGCSDVAQDFGLAPGDGDRGIYWEGTSVRGQGHYVTELLARPQGAFTYSVSVPDVRDLFATFAGQSVSYAAIVCYPTSASNTRPDYPYDAALGKFVPRMQRAGETPLWADADTRYPVLLYSHGLAGSPLSGEYLRTIALFASYGYVVIAPFHGDGRFADVTIDGLSDLVRFFFHGGIREVVEMQAIRPLSLKSALDTLLTDPNYRDHVDADRVAGFGTSLGAESLLLYAGARLTTDFYPYLRSAQVMSDTRLKAVAGYVPYFGQRLLPAFGDDQNGVDGMTVPFLGIVGTADDTAPLLLTEQGVNRMKGARYVVAFDGLTHRLRLGDTPDIYTWTVTFFDAYLNSSAAARGQIARMDKVNGGAADSVHIAYTPLPPPPPTQAVFTFPAGQLPSDLAQVSVGGSLSSADLKLTVNVAEILQALSSTGIFASACNVYVLALVPGAVLGLADPAWYVKRASGDWTPLQMPIAAYLENAAGTPFDSPAVADILAGTDISSLAGTEIYVGYGISDMEMLTARRYRGVYKVQ